MTLLKEKNYGTPKIESKNNVTGFIDGIEVSVPEGTSIMRAASTIGIDVPVYVHQIILMPLAHAGCAL